VSSAQTTAALHASRKREKAVDMQVLFFIIGESFEPD
jgi:hypothetical protein